MILNLRCCVTSMKACQYCQQVLPRTSYPQALGISNQVTVPHSSSPQGICYHPKYCVTIRSNITLLASRESEKAMRLQHWRTTTSHSSFGAVLVYKKIFYLIHGRLVIFSPVAFRLCNLFDPMSSLSSFPLASQVLSSNQTFFSCLDALATICLHFSSLFKQTSTAERICRIVAA